MSKTIRSITLILYLIIILIFFKINPIYQSLTPEPVISLSQLKIAAYVTITPKELKYSGYDATKSGKIIGKYYYAVEDKRCYFFLLSYTNNMPDHLENPKITGKVKKLGAAYTDMLKSLGNDINWSDDELLNYVSPLYIDQTNQTQKVTPIILGLLFIPFVILLIPSKKSNKN